MTNTAWLAVALLIVTAALSAYTASLLIRKARLEKRLDRARHPDGTTRPRA